MPTLSRAGVDLHYQRSGKNSGNGAAHPVLLLAGVASDSASWSPITDSLAQHAEIITLDNRCTGQTRPLLSEISRDLMVGDVLHLLDTCAIDKVTLIGHSMGAMISWAVACAAPERISGVLAASAPFVIHPSRVDLFSTLARLRTETNEADWFRLLFQFLFSKSFFEGSGQPDSEMEDAVSAAVQISMNYEHKQGLERFKQQCSALPTFLETPELPQTFSFPCLALTGANDKLFTPEDLSSSYAAHPEIKLEVINDAAHAVHWENTTAFVDIASRFINQVTR